MVHKRDHWSHRRGSVVLAVAVGVVSLLQCRPEPLATWIFAGKQSSRPQRLLSTQRLVSPGVVEKIKAVLGEASTEEVEEEVEVAPKPNVDDIIYELLQGNQRAVDEAMINQNRSAIEVMVEEPYTQTEKKAVILSSADNGVAADCFFDVKKGELLSIKVMGYVSGDHDGVMGSIDFALTASDAPPLLLVLGDSKSEPIQAAMRVAMARKGMDGIPESNLKMKGIEESDLDLLQTLLPACQDAILQLPRASFSELVEEAAKLNVWNTIQTLMGTSPTVFQRVTDGSLQLHGAYLNTDTGAVQMMGQHPALAKLLESPPADDRVRTASSPSVPPEEALAALVSGNRRFTSKNREVENRADEFVLLQLGEGGQRPMATVLGCADSRAPVEMTFDKRPGDIYVLRTAGNIIANSKGALLGSTEFAISALQSKLVVVIGHTKCGVVNEAVKAVRTKADIADVPGSIGELLVDLLDAAKKAVKELPDADISEQVALATKLNVFNGIKRMIDNSDIVKSTVQKMDVAVHGAVYDISTGKVEWLGQHPDLEEIVGRPMPVHRWKVTPYTHTVSRMARPAQRAIDKMRFGNAAFVAGKNKKAPLLRATRDPYAIVVFGTEVPVSAYDIFDASPGYIVGHRCLGNIVGTSGGVLFSSLEYAVVRFNPPVLVVLGYSDDSVVKYSIRQVQGSEVAPFAMRPVLDQVSVAVVRALNEVSSSGSTRAGADMRVQRLAVEFNIWYAVEQLIVNSAIIRKAVKEGLEVQGAILDHLTGEVEFMGSHPMVHDLIKLGGTRASS